MRAVDENLVVNKINVGLMCRLIKNNKLVILTVYSSYLYPLANKS